MTIEELNKLIQEELGAYLNEAEDGDDDIKVTTDEPAEDEGGEALDTLRQIFDMLKPIVEPEEEGEEEPEMGMEDEEGEEEGDEEEENLDENVKTTILNTVKKIKQAFTGNAIEVVEDWLENQDADLIAKAAKEGGKKDFIALFRKMQSDFAGEYETSHMTALQTLLGKADTLNYNYSGGGLTGTRKMEAVDNHTFFRGDNANRVAPKAKDVQGTREKATLKEGFDGTSRFQKLANIKK